jgi:dTDP-glucose 4,6-dehydratase
MVDRLLAEGHEVFVYDNCITGRWKNIDHHKGNPKLHCVDQDVSYSFTFDGTLDYVMHMASPASPPDFKTIPFETIRAGSFATHVLLDLALAKKARFFLTSTSEIYGDPPADQHPQVETYFGNVNPIGDRSVYDEAKRYAEMITMAYAREHKLETRIVRIFNTYGPRMRPDDGRVVTNFIAQALRDEPVTLYGDGSQTRSFCYATDNIDGLYRLLTGNEPGPVNIGNPIERTVKELAEIIIKLTGSKSQIVCKPQPFVDDPRQRKPDISKAKRTLGWEPKVSIEEGLEKTIAYMREELKR